MRTLSLKTIPILPHFIPLPPLFKKHQRKSYKLTITRSKSFEFYNSNSGGKIRYEGESELFLNVRVRKISFLICTVVQERFLTLSGLENFVRTSTTFLLSLIVPDYFYDIICPKLCPDQSVCPYTFRHPCIPKIVIQMALTFVEFRQND